MPKVLIVSYFYPPCHRIGGLRPSKFSRYLPEYGWQPLILTVKPDGLPAEFPLEVPEPWVRRTPAFDINLLPRLVVGRERVAREGYAPRASGRLGGVLRGLGEWYRQLFNFPDPEIGWYPFAIRAGLRLVQREQPAVILSSSVPITSHIVAARLAARSRLPWVADFRDLWTDAHNWRRQGPLRGLELHLERLLMRRAAAVITVSAPWAERLRRYGRPVYAIPNGFDEAEFAHTHSNAFSAGRPFTMVYTGTLNVGKQDPDPLFEGLATLARNGIITPADFRLEMVGWYLSEAERLAEAWGVREFVHVSPALPHADAVRLCRSATALLFFSWAHGRGDVEEGWYSAKVFEYLATRRRILAVGPGLELGCQLIHDSGAGEISPTADAVVAVLGRWIAEYRASGALWSTIDQTRLAPFTRRAQTGQLVKVLNRVGARGMMLADRP